MRLKRLDLVGYKSFATRCTFEFDEGITAIVGPNGCGKSNIADAIRWVMGEHSYRTLRAKSTEDMIFAGSRQRSRLGMAEVVITLDNSDGWLPIDYSEVTVGRRAYRSGENEYLLNGNRVRYRDVLDILGVAGLARSTYTVIGQGMVDAALSLRPEARRVLFEEAAGIAPHLRKRAESLRRIEETQRNLERVNDILNELRPRANRLRRQAERAEEYLLLKQDLEELQRIFYGHQWQRLQRELARIEERLGKRQAQLESQRTYSRSFQKRLETISAQQVTEQRSLEALRDHEATLRGNTEALRRESAVISERIRLYEQQRRSLKEELRSLGSRRDVLQQEIEHATAELAEQRAAYGASRAELDAAREELAGIDDSRRAVEQERDKGQARLTQLVTTISDSRARLEQLMAQRAKLAAESREGETALAELAERLRTLEIQGKQIVEQEQALVQKQGQLQERQAELENEISATRDQTSNARETAIKIEAERDRLVARRDSLTRLRQELTGYYPGVRQVLSSGNRLGGILGTVANLMAVPEELEQAIESALGPRLQNIVTERWEDAEKAIAYLKQNRAGWATFLPRDTLRPRPALDLQKKSPEVVGVASKLVRYEERLRPVFELLLGRVVIVRDLPVARRLLRERTGASLFVTLGGETVQPTGALSGGTRRKTANLLGQEREWRELPARIEAIEARLDEVLQILSTHQDHLDELGLALGECQRQIAQLRTERDAAHDVVAQHARDVRDVRRERAWQESHIAQAKEDMGALAQGEQDLRSELAGAQQEQIALTKRLQALTQRLASEQDRGLRQRVAELETRAAVAERTVDSQRRLLESHHKNLAQLVQQIEEKHAQEAHLHDDLESLAQKAKITGARLEAIEKELADTRRRMEPVRQELARLEQSHRDTERQHAQSRERLREAELELNRAIMERDRVKDQQTALIRDIEADLGPIHLPETVSHQLRLGLGDDVVELPRVASLPPGLSDEIRQLKTRLRRLGNINPEAPNEYKQMLERRTFLQGQAGDLRGAIATIYEVIQELDAIIQRDFALTVEKADEAFRIYFRALFNGGSARLVLTDPENMTTTGVDIIAHPPGKRAQSLSLLSGGERALTAVALLFALLRGNPVPFCFLDEVDATLDEANVARFRDLLQEHSQRTQFIVITHNRRTIEAATTIYGISMGERGVSQSVSLKLAG